MTFRSLQLRFFFFFFALSFLSGGVLMTARANVPGGGTNGANVTLTDSGSTVTIGNGIMSIICNKSSGQITTINYTFNNTGSSQTLNLISGNPNGGKLYWEDSTSQSLTFTYSLITDPASNGGNYAEIAVSTTSVSNDVLEVHYSMLRGNSGFYVTPIYFHRSIDGAFSLGECRDNIYAGAIFNWMSVDAARNRLMEVSGGSAIGVQGAPVEVSLWTSGIYSGQYEDKYKYGADWGLQRAWGWSSVGSGGKNVGLWNITGSAEYYPGGPMRHELMEHIGTTILNMHNGAHYGGGGLDGNWAAGEVWTKVYGPYLIYCNNITNTITATNQAAQTLYSDALAQAAAEQTAWPYSWFANANYASPANRGTVSGQIVINDIDNPNASASNLWVGLVRQPSTTTSTYDFENWVKPYQFWVKTDANGNFTIPNVIATNNYTLYAFGPGAAGTFQSQNQTGGNMPNTFDLPASPFSVAVTGGATNSLGSVTWTPTRVGPTVFEIGFPNRIGDKFKHGDDYWVGDIGPNAANPSPIWSKWLEYQFDYPSGPNYTVGQSRWTTDWNFVQPCVTDSAGNYNGSTSTITFNLASAPSGTASFYIALSSDLQGPLIIQVNGNNIAGSTGYFPNYNSSGNESDVTIRESNHGIFSDARFSISSGFLHQGQNTITINMRKGGSNENHAMYDYIRLELPGYIPPPPSNVVAYAGNNCNLVCWPVTPGATSYNIWRALPPISGLILLTNGVVGPVCGSGANNATWLDTNAVAGTTYYYAVQSVNPVGTSTNSPQSANVTPPFGIGTSAPAAPTGLSVSSSGHHSVTLNWNASSGANFYTIYRSTLMNNGGGASNVLSTIVLNNAITGTSYTDVSPTDGSIYSYTVAANSAGGTSTNSAPVFARPLPVAPATAPASLTAVPLNVTNITLNWSAVSGAIGYVVSRATSVNGTYTLLNSITETTYTDVGIVSNATYYYKVTPVNAGGTATNGITTTRPAAPASLSAVATNVQVTLTWPTSIGATGYIVLRSGNIIASGITSTNYVNTGLANGTTYNYTVEAVGSAATSGNSPQASATTAPSAPISLTAAATNAQVTLTWTASAGATSYNVKRSTTSGGPYTTNATPTTSNYVDTGLASGTTYYYVVSAVNAAGQSANSIQVTATTVPPSPTGLAATGGLQQVTLNWIAAAGATSYNVKRSLISGGSYTTAATPSGTNYVDTGLADSTTYYYVISATNSAGQSADSSEAGATTVTPISTTATTTSLNLLSDVTYGTPVTFIATVSPAPTNADTVTFEDSSNVIGSGIITGGIASYMTSSTQLAAGSHSITAVFGGDVNYLGSQSGVSNQIVNPQTPSLNTAPTASPITYGQTLSASVLSGGGVTNALGTNVPGNFIFTTNITPAAGTANQPVTFTPADTNDYNSLNLNVSVLVNPEPVTPVITLNGRAYDGTTTAASIAGETLTGVIGGDDVNLGGSGVVDAFTNQNAGSYSVNITGLSLSGTSAGNYTLTSSTTTATGVITPASSMTTITSSTNPAPYESDVTFTATVSGADTPGGSVQFLTNGVLFDTEALAAGTATSADTASLPPGTNNITGIYSGDMNYNGSTNTVEQVTSVPQFKGLNFGGNGLVLGGSGGLAGGTYYILVSSNMLAPLDQWTPVLTNHFDANGDFNFTNGMNTNIPQGFFILQVQ